MSLALASTPFTAEMPSAATFRTAMAGLSDFTARSSAATLSTSWRRRSMHSRRVGSVGVAILVVVTAAGGVFLVAAAPVGAAARCRCRAVGPVAVADATARVLRVRLGHFVVDAGVRGEGLDLLHGVGQFRTGSGVSPSMPPTHGPNCGLSVRSDFRSRRRLRRCLFFSRWLSFSFSIFAFVAIWREWWPLVIWQLGVDYLKIGQNSTAA